MVRNTHSEEVSYSTSSKWAWLILLFPLLFLLLLFFAYFLLNSNAQEQTKVVGPSYSNILRVADDVGIDLRASDLQQGIQSISEDYTKSMQLLSEQPGESLSERVQSILKTNDDSQALRSCQEENKALLTQIDNLNTTCSMANSCEVSETNGTVTCKVYFGTDAKDLSIVNENFVRDVFLKYPASGFSSVTVHGHTDTAGESNYNMLLSRRRAKEVGELVSNYFKGSISVTASGENNPPYAAADNESDPRNRVVIVNMKQR